MAKRVYRAKKGAFKRAVRKTKPALRGFLKHQRKLKTLKKKATKKAVQVKKAVKARSFAEFLARCSCEGAH